MHRISIESISYSEIRVKVSIRLGSFESISYSEIRGKVSIRFSSFESISYSEIRGRAGIRGWVRVRIRVGVRSFESSSSEIELAPPLMLMKAWG